MLRWSLAPSSLTGGGAWRRKTSRTCSADHPLILKWDAWRAKRFKTLRDARGFVLHPHDSADELEQRITIERRQQLAPALALGQADDRHGEF
jgi:hypothetical protein